MSGKRFPSPLAWLVAAVMAASVALLVVAALEWRHEDLVLLAALAGLALVSEALDFAPFANSRVSLSVALILVAGTLSGLPGVAVVASVVAVADLALHPKPLFKAAFNEGALLLAGAAYVVVLELFSTGYGAEAWPDILAPVLLGVSLNFAVNSGLVALAISLETQRHPFAVWSQQFRWLFPHDVIVGVLAAAAATAYDRWELSGLALLLVPLAMVWFALRQYVAMASALSRRLQRAN